MIKKRRRVSSGKYQKTIYLWTSLLFIAAQIVFSTAVLVKTNQQEMESNYEMNEQIFQQAAYNVEQSAQVIRGLCKSLFVNPVISKMMYGTMREEDIYDWVQQFQSVCDPILLSNPQIHSIYVYNRGMNHLFSSYRYMNFQDEGLTELLDEKESLSLLTPVVRMIDSPADKTKKRKVITYILYDSMDQAGRPDGAIIINVNLDEFTGEIKRLITFSEEEKSEILIFDQNGKIDLNWKKEETDDAVAAEVQKMIQETELSEGNNFVLKVKKIAGEKYGIFFTRVPEMNWTLVKVQSYREAFSRVNNQKMMIVIASVAFCAVMLTLIYFLARKIYSPIGQLVQKVKGDGSQDSPDTNDFQYLNRAYENLFRKAREYQKKDSQKKIVLTYNLKSLLIDGNETDETVWETLQAVDEELFRRDYQFGVEILQIDGYQRFREKYDRKDQELYKYAIENVLSEVLGNAGYRSAVIPVAEDKMAVILHGNPMGEAEYRRDMEKCCRVANENIKKFFQISFSVSVSAYRQGIGSIHELYCNAEKALLYRYVLGREAVIFYDYEAEQADDKEIASVMNQVNMHIREDKKDGIRTDFEKLSELAVRQNSDRLMEFISGQVIQILHMLDVRERANHVYRGNIFLQRYTEILSLETWAEMSERLLGMLTEDFALEDKQTQKTNLLVNTIEKIVHEEFTDPNLCIQQISDMIKMSSQYVGRVFKCAAGVSVAEYINEYRLKKSVDIMMTTGCNVNEVLKKIGMESESQYYRLFKKKYKTTPRVYMLGLLAGEDAQAPPG